jgi:hypothetical protein
MTNVRWCPKTKITAFEAKADERPAGMPGKKPAPEQGRPFKSIHIGY